MNVFFFIIIIMSIFKCIFILIFIFLFVVTTVPLYGVCHVFFKEWHTGHHCATDGIARDEHSGKPS